ncbi:hypothetical protein [Chitiniphilus eburneus]|uniref:DUF1090 family protein n=1 Tax=Chitiniphilus eburneus TaxID=2571148 RepID=A0A4U0QBZ3_9NEIS|nr:hypothetical protein [Chitiniphilus eburneus]TJZ78909.1 hypothetical protein FAZ21_01080 [Chitiniphilus eburneus]
MVVKFRALLILALAASTALAAAPTPAPYRADPDKLLRLERERCEKLVRERQLIKTRLTRETYRYNIEKLNARLTEVNAEYDRYGRCAQVMPTPTPTPLPTPTPTPKPRAKR